MKFGPVNNISRTVFCISILLIILVNMSIASAVTASIGNARMILRAKTGDVIEKTVLVKNINNETVNIEIFASGDLEKDITIIDKKFSLIPGEEKNAKFSIQVKKEGTFESKINVQFSSGTEKNGVGLSSNVIVIAEEGEGWFDFESDEESDDNSTSDSNIIDNIFNSEDSENSTSIGKKILIGLSATGIVFLIFLAVLISYSLKTKKKASYENEERFKVIKPKKRASRDG